MQIFSFCNGPLLLGILTHAPAWGATLEVSRCLVGQVVSTLAPRVGGDQRTVHAGQGVSDFNPRPRVGGDLGIVAGVAVVGISTHAPREGSDAERGDGQEAPGGISTLAPRVGSDYRAPRRGVQGLVSTHAPREGSDLRIRTASCCSTATFQPTLPARGATPRPGAPGRWPWHFNPRSPRGERPWRRGNSPAGRPDFNPRSPRGERPVPGLTGGSTFVFQPTLPARGATTGL